MPTLKRDQLALDILAGCEQGSTEAALVACGVKTAALDRLVAAGKIERRITVLAKPRGVEVTWYYLKKGPH